MKVNFNKPFTDFRGNPVEVGGKQQVIGDQLCVALFNLAQVGGKPATPEQKYQAYRVCTSISRNPDGAELTAEDAALVKTVAGEIFGAGAYGQICDIIENK